MRFAGLLGMLAIAFTLSAADPVVGTWKLNASKSEIVLGPPATTITYEETPNGIKRTGESMDAAGKTGPSFEYTAKYDGKEYPVTGSNLYEAIVLKRVNDRTVKAAMKKSGKVVATARRVVSADGKTLTITINSTNSSGTKVRTVSIYDKE